MSETGSDTHRPKPTVFLSYASEDRVAARLIGDALPAYGLEVWLDESELGGGDAWDQKIRRQIRECDFFMPVVSAQTEARHEGYFRREWRLAVERTLDMADDHLFLLPVVIDGTAEAHARVPEKFLTVQWLKLPGGRPNPALEALCRRIVAGDTAASTGSRRLPPARPFSTLIPVSEPPAPVAPVREFPKEEPGQKVRFWFEVTGWSITSIWMLFNRLPKWVRTVVYIWLGILLLKGFDDSRPHDSSSGLTSSQAKKLKAITQQFQGTPDKAALTSFARQIAREFSDDSDDSGSNKTPILAIPFAVPPGDSKAQNLSDSTFAQTYGAIAISHHGRVGLVSEPLPSCALPAMLERARTRQSQYAVCGSIDTQAVQLLTIKIAAVSESSLLWSKSYAVPGADPEKIAAEVNAALPAIDED